MEKILRFSPDAARQIAVRLANGQAELYADDVDGVVVLAAGDERSVADLRVEFKDGTLTVEQPNYGLALNTLTDGKWLQLCIRVPESFQSAVRVSTVTGRASARGLRATELALDSVSGDVSARGVTGGQVALRSISGDIGASKLKADRVSARTVSGDIALEDIETPEIKLNTVNGRIDAECVRPFERMDVNTVSGSVRVTAPCTQMDVTLRSVSGQVRTERVSILEGAPVVLRMTSVSGDLWLTHGERA